MRLLFLLFPFLVLSACTQMGASVANAPTWFDGVERVAYVSYGQDPLQKLDVYAPEGALDNNPNLPVLIFIHGGNWQMGSKDLYKFVGSRFARHGFIVVVPDYRKYPQVKYPAFVEDGAGAVQWVYNNIGEYGGDPDTLFLSGHSAGAHTGAILTLDERYLKSASVPHDIIKGFAGLAGPYDFTPEEPDLKDIFGPPSAYPQMQATNFVDGSEPPMLLLAGGEDEAVHIRNLQKLENALKDHNVPVQTKVYDGLNHVEMVTSLTWVYNDIAPVERDMLDFFAQDR